MTWILAHPIEAAYACLVVLGVMAVLDYGLSVRLGWEMEPKHTAAGYVAGLVPAAIFAVVAGPVVAVGAATLVLLASVVAILYIGREEPERPDWEKFMSEGGGSQ